MIVGSICSGIAPDRLAWSPLGWKHAWFAETNPHPSAVLSHRHPEISNRGDFTKIEADAGSIDLLVGGTPCQGFSLAGLRGGLDDDRSNLALEYLRLAGRIRPRWLVWENVPGVLSANGGRDFGAFLGGMAELGYGWAYRVLDAQFFGCSASRRRVFVVGYLGDWRRPAAVLFERSCLSVHRPRARFESDGAAPGTRRGPSSPGRAIAVTDRKRAGGRMTEWRVELAYSPIVRCGGGNRTARQIVTPAGELRCLTPRETERLLGYPDDYTAVPFNGGMLADTWRNEALGNSIAVTVKRWLGERIDSLSRSLCSQWET